MRHLRATGLFKSFLSEVGSIPDDEWKPLVPRHSSWAKKAYLITVLYLLRRIHAADPQVKLELASDATFECLRRAEKYPFPRFASYLSWTKRSAFHEALHDFRLKDRGTFLPVLEDLNLGRVRTNATSLLVEKTWPHLESAMNLLRDDERKIINDYYWNGATDSDIARRLGLRPPGVRVKSGDRWGQKVWRLRNAAEKRLSEFLHSCGVDPDLWNSRGTAPKAWMF